jgi:GDP-mannose 6-dehydrogenase
MKLSFVGLGYVGLVSSICLGSKNHTIYGYDKDSKKISSLKDKNLYIDEKDLDALFSENKDMYFSESIDQNLFNSDLVFVCVDTPYDQENILNLDNLFNAIDEIATKKVNDKKLNIVIRSTIPPRTIDFLAEKYNGKNLTFTSNPEFLREGNAISDFFNAEITVIGSTDKDAIDCCSKLYESFSSKKIVTQPENAEMIKFVNNSYHALKITFANEVGQICNSIGINSKDLMEIFKSDHQLNISDKYFNPGFAYGGSCLPKDTNGLINLAKESSINVNVLSSIEKSNRELIERIGEKINTLEPSKILILGITFKEGTDDLRGSPIIELAKIIKNDTFYFIDEKIKVGRLDFENNCFINIKDNFEEMDFDLCIYNYGTLSNTISEKIEQSNFIFDLNNKLKKEKNIIQIT